jgi:hypothetical protein
MVLLRYRAGLLGLVLLALVPTVCVVEPNCKVVGLMAEYWHVVDASHGQTYERQVQEFFKALVATREDLYGKGGLGFESAQSLDAAILRALDDSRRHESDINGERQKPRRGVAAVSHLLQGDIPRFSGSWSA